MGVTVTGLSELTRNVEALPADLTSALSGIASATAHRIAAHAAQILRSNTHGTGETAAAINVIADPKDNQFTVNSPAPSEKPKNLPLWLEFGTRYMAARPYMRPAVDAEADRYLSEMTKASERVVTNVMP
jgi:HK97 gp10 family phage protein